MADSEPTQLPIFELPAVLLPGELMPLHIFEERYKRMVGGALDSGEPFGIVFRDDEDGARSVGCTARVAEVLERFDDGRLNIVVAGEHPFRVLDRFDAPDYPAGEVELIDLGNEAPDHDEEAARAARATFAELLEEVGAEPASPEDLAAHDAYALAGRIELPADTKQRLLELRSEGERMRVLDRSLRAVARVVKRSAALAEHARTNGRVISG
ncbi:MAG TPA: LON peptidase substrate-binding domain-containing protein [Solirubrobacterales bacterium]|nr:LON peptidase substrate-binding domain-containing protein [Solirubrobacterales bacterium]